MSQAIPDPEYLTFTGYHGTDYEAVPSIKENGFQESDHPKLWMGRGIYFFLEGCTVSAHRDAKYWAETASHDKKFKNFAILRTKIKIRRASLFDLTTDPHLRFFNDYRDKIYKQTDWRNPRFRSDESGSCLADVAILGMCNKYLRVKFDGIVGWFYTKRKFQRINEIPSNVPSTTILCIKSSAEDAIDRAGIELVEAGPVHPHS